MIANKSGYASDERVTGEDRRSYYLIGAPEKINRANAEQIRNAAERAIESGHSQIVFDFGRTLFLDCAGLGSLTTIRSRLNSIGGKLYLTSLSVGLNSLLETLGILKIIEVIDDTSEIPVIMGDTIRYSEHDSYALFKIPHQFKLNSVASLRTAAEDAIRKGHINFIFDFTQTRFITSVGIGTLLNLQDKLKQSNGGVYLLGICNEIRALLRTTSVFGIIREFSTLQEIEAHLGGNRLRR